jgi:phage/plasmid-associated DNA primase
MTDSLNIKNKSLNKILNKTYSIDVLEHKIYDERKINIDLYEKVVDNLDELQDFIGLCYDPKTCQRIEWSGTKTIITETFKKKKKNTTVQYAPTKSNSKGRHFSKEKSLQGLSRVVRHLICHENYTDIDIKNCHPVVFTQLCAEYNFDCSHITYYIDNRTKCLDELMTLTNYSKDDCKQSMLSLLNGGSCNKIFNNFQVPEWFSNFAYQIEKIHEQFVKHNDLKDCIKEVQKSHGIDCFNFNGKVVNRLLCRYENIILQHAIHYCSLNDIYVASPQFDGFLCERDEKINQDFLQKLELFIQKETGFRVNFCIKEMDEHIPLKEKLDTLKTKKEILGLLKTKILKEKQHEKERKEREKQLEKERKEKEKREKDLPLPNCSDECLGIFFLEQIGDNIKYHKPLNLYYIYNHQKFLWENVPVENLMILFSDILIPYITELQSECESDVILDKYEKMKELVCSTKKQIDILKQVKIRLNDDSHFIDNNFNKAITLFPFRDKVIELDSGITRDRKKEDYFTMTTNNTFLDENDDFLQKEKKVYEYIREILLTHDISDDMSDDDMSYIDCFLTYFSHFLTNDNSIKKIITLIGEKDAGKTAFINLVVSVLQDFCTIAPRRLVINSKSESVLGTEFFPLIDKRAFFISELQEHEHYNEALLKSISGNDKYFKVRGSSNSGYENVIIQAKGIISTNESANYSEPAFISRLLYVKFPNKFKTNSDKLKEILAFKDILFTILCKKAKILIENKYNFVPHENMIKETVKENSSKDSIKPFFEDNLIKTENYKDKVLKSSLYPLYSQYCKSNNLIVKTMGLFNKDIANEPYNLQYKKTKGYDYYRNLKIKSEFDIPKDDDDIPKDDDDIPKDDDDIENEFNQIQNREGIPPL